METNNSGTTSTGNYPQAVRVSLIASEPLKLVTKTTEIARKTVYN